jgi:glyoxylase-like metal-dependent hydrolase (beta-lactamase superfamily II)/rhodanese-related sulfurtransferase
VSPASEVAAVVIRQHFDPVSSTYSYLLVDSPSGDAVLIDPVLEQHARDAALIRELGVRVLSSLDTHCHADHVTGAWAMKQAFGCRIGLAEVYGASNVDLPLKHGMVVRFGGEALEVRATPGHTAGCLSLVSADHRFVFTGDALLVRAAGRTDFQQGSAARLFESVHTQLFSLPDDCVVYPAHDYEGRTSSTIGEERRHNPRLGGGAKLEDFVGYMDNLGLPHPKLLAVAVPANMSCGRNAAGGAEPAPPGWGPVVQTYAGVPEIAPEWLADHLNEVEVVDVRSRAEFEGELGHVKGSKLVPLDELRSRMDEISSGRPVVLVCQTGKRSAMAATILRKAGLPRVANLAGGMVRWRQLGLPG